MIDPTPNRSLSFARALGNVIMVQWCVGLMEKTGGSIHVSLQQLLAFVARRSRLFDRGWNKMERSL